MAGFANDVVFANNGDFSIAGSNKGSAANGLNTDGQMWIGSTATNAGGTHINVGGITSPGGTINVGYSSPNITLDVSGSFPPVAFSAYLSATQSAVTGDGTQYTPVYDGVLSNVGGGYDNTTGVFTAPATGVYMFSYTMCYINTGAATAFVEGFASGGPQNFNFRVSQCTAANAYLGTLATNGTTIVPLNAGTTMQMLAAAYGTTKTVDISGGELILFAFTSMFSGFRVA